MTEQITKLQKLDQWDFPNHKHIPDGYDMTQVPVASDDNFQVLVDAHNNLVDTINTLFNLKDEDDDWSK